MRFALALLGLPMLAAPPSYTVDQAIRAEWERQAPAFTPAQVAGLPPADRARLEFTLKRIGAPGAPALLSPELEKPTPEVWEARAAAAKTPRERFDALFFLNRLKSPRALSALNGLEARNAKTWPEHLHLEAQVATARLNGCEMSPALQGFLDALQRAGKIDPVRAQAARLRLVLAGQEKELLPPVKATPASVLALMDAFRGAKGLDHCPWFKRFLDEGDWASLGMISPPEPDKAAVLLAAADRCLELPLTPSALDRLMDVVGYLGTYQKSPMVQWACQYLDKTSADTRKDYLPAGQTPSPSFAPSLLPVLRKTDPTMADRLRATALGFSDPIARAAAIDDMAEAPADLDALQARLWKVEEYDGVQVLLQSLEKWKLPEARRRAILARFYDHPCWTARLDAFTQLSKLDPQAPWPKAPAPTPTDEAILKEARCLATLGKPVRMRLTFAGDRRVTLRLDPRNAPMNVANLVLLARKGFFNGRLVPRVVPDFVVQMGSPCDTMDGGPGYTVRCEDSLDWYGPGSVGMALSGKDTGGSQFFITLNAAPHLTGRYTRVGELEDPDRGLKILEELELGARLEGVEVL